MLMQKLEVRVAQKRIEADAIASFELISVDGAELPAFSAGSHIDVEVPGGFVRQYSLCNKFIDKNHYLIAVLKEDEGRGGSRAMHEIVQEGDVLRIRAPRNSFALKEGNHPNLLLAGGIGVTPILCMAEQLAVAGSDFEMHYCARSKSRMAFRERIEASSYAARAHFHFDDGPPEQKIDFSSIFSGLNKLTHVYVCGPKGFIDAALGAARAASLADEQLHFEPFAANAELCKENAAFEVRLAHSGIRVHVHSGETVVHALERAGVSVMTSCEVGVCGTCLTRVLSGEVDHRDSFLTADERAANDRFTPCCSRAKSDCLVLDL